MSRYLIIVPMTKNYLEEGETLLRSLLVHNPDIPVHVISRDGEAGYLLSDYPNVQRVINEPRPTFGLNPEFRQIRTSRFRHAADVRGEFDAVGIIDADMVSIRPMSNIFKMAESGVILACSNNTLYRYTKKDFDEMFIDAPANINVVSGSFSTVPMFLNPSAPHVYNFLMAIWNNKTGNDLLAINLLAHVTDDIYNKYLYLLNSYSFNNIHHSMLKPETFITRTSDGHYSYQGEPVYMLHGPLSKPAYWDQLLEPMIKNYGYYPKYIECAKNCIQILKDEYRRYFIKKGE